MLRDLFIIFRGLSFLFNKEVYLAIEFIFVLNLFDLIFFVVFLEVGKRYIVGVVSFIRVLFLKYINIEDVIKAGVFFRKGDSVSLTSD